MKVLNIDYNDYKRKFISIEIEPNESCNTEPFTSDTSVSFYPVDPSGKTHEILCHKRKFTTGLTGQTKGYGKLWAVGCGSGAAMGWSQGHTLETVLNAAKAFCKVIETTTLVATVYLDLPDEMENYSKDSY